MANAATTCIVIIYTVIVHLVMAPIDTAYAIVAKIVPTYIFMADMFMTCIGWPV